MAEKRLWRRAAEALGTGDLLEDRKTRGTVSSTFVGISIVAGLLCILVWPLAYAVEAKDAKQDQGSVKEGGKQESAKEHQPTENEQRLSLAAARGNLTLVKELLGTDPKLLSRESCSRALQSAVFRGRVKLARFLVAKGADVNTKGSDSLPVLHAAVQHGHREIVELLLRHAASVHQKDTYGRTPLLMADSREIVKLLLAAGANVNAKSADGVTALRQAARHADQETVEMLLAKGARHDVFTAAAVGRGDLVRNFLKDDPALAKAKDGSGSTPLIMAAKWGQAEVAKLLIESGADVKLRVSSWSPTPLEVAASREVAELLVAHGARVNDRNESGRVPLHFAKNRKVAELFLTSGVNVDVMDKRRFTPLHLARNKDVAQLLLTKGAEIGAKTKDGRMPLHTATEEVRTEVVELLLANGADVNAKGEHGQTALHAAAGQGQIEIAKLLLSEGAGVNAKDNYGSTPLHAAAAAGRKEMVDFLLAEGAHPDPRAKSGATPLDNAVFDSHGDVVEMLLARGASPNTGSARSWLALQRAALNGDMEIAELLIQKGASVNAPGYEGRTALHTAVYWGHRGMTGLLLASGADARARDQSGNTPLHSAAVRDYKMIVELLVENGADVDAKNDFGWTPLHAATANGEKNAIAALLDLGADPNVEDDMGRTPFREACRRRPNKEIVDVYLAHGARMDIFVAAHQEDVARTAELLAADPGLANARNEMGWAPLHMAALHNRKRSVDQLLAKGADANAADRSGRTPLRYAARGHNEIVRMLLAHGADPNAADYEGRSPLHVAIEDGHKKTAELLLTKAGKLGIFAAAALSRIDRLGAILREDPVFADARDGHGRSPLHWAAKHGSPNVVELLLAEGSDVNARDKWGDTPLHVARTKEIAEALLTKGADLMARGMVDRTPLHSAASIGNLAVVKVLIARGADVNAVNSMGWTPLSCAGSFGRDHKDVIELLRKHEAKDWVGPPVQERASVPWGKEVNGLKCRLTPATQIVPVREGRKPEHMAVFVKLDIRPPNGQKRVRFLPPWAPRAEPGGDIFQVVGPNDKKVACWAEDRGSGEPIKRWHFERYSVTCLVRLAYDFTKPGAYKVTFNMTRESLPKGQEILIYYRGEVAKARENPDNVWIGTLTSNTATIEVVQRKPAAGQRAPK